MQDVERHTSELKPSREAAERVVSRMRSHGWEVYEERVPLSGQYGFYCVRVVPDEGGDLVRQAHSVRWNLFDSALVPVTIDCWDDAVFLSFLWRHAGHEDFSFFEYHDGDVGFVCYCEGHRGFSLALRVSDDFEPGLSDEATEIVGAFVPCFDDED